MARAFASRLAALRQLPLAAIVALVVATGVVLSGIAVVAYPLWADGLAQAQAREKIALRGGFSKVRFTGFDLKRDRVIADGLLLEGPGFGVRIKGLEVPYKLSWWPLQITVLAAGVKQVEVKGDGDALAQWARSQRSKGGSSASSSPSGSSGKSGGRMRINLKKVRVAQGELDLSVKKLGRGWVQRVATNFSVEADPKELIVVGQDIALQRPNGRAVGADRVSTRLGWAQVFRKPAFPATVAVQGGFAQISDRVAVDGVGGTIVVPDEEAQRFKIDLSGGFSDRGEEKPTQEKLWSLAGEGRRDLSAGKIDLDMKAFPMYRVPRVLSQLPVVDSENATVGGHLGLTLADGKVGIDGQLSLAGFNISHRLLAREPVHDVGFKLDVKASLDPRRRHLDLHEAKLRRGEMTAILSGALTHARQVEERHYTLDLKIPRLPCQAMLESIPKELIPGLAGITLKGRYELNMHFDADFSDLDALKLEGLRGSFGLAHCIPVRVPGRLSAHRLDGTMAHRVTLRDGTTRRLYLEPGHSSFTPLEEIAAAMPAALMTTEDGGFWRHNGFLTSPVRNALRANLQAGEVRLGASTLSMQLVKNLLLSHERTLSRKLQELFLTWYIELTLSKSRILELYLNIVEFGPGVYGVTRAADHYFEKTPNQLNSLEAAYLSSMLPSPVRRHEHYCRGKLSKAFDTKVRRVHRLMESKGRIETWKYETYKDEAIEFSRRDLSSEKHCLERIEALLEATEVQQALTGMLNGGRYQPGAKTYRWKKAPEREKPAHLDPKPIEEDSLGGSGLLQGVPTNLIPRGRRLPGGAGGGSGGPPIPKTVIPKPGVVHRR